MPDNTLLGVGQDGLISVWTTDLKLKKHRFILDDNKQQNRKVKWITDSTLMGQYNKLIIGTCDRELRLYELSNFEPYCQIVGLETLPLHLGYSPRDANECVIYYGDEQGCVNIILISHVADTLRNWTKSQVIEEIPSVNIDNIEEQGLVKYIRWKVHNDWVTQIRYVHSIESIISSSNDDFTALVIGCVEGTKNVQQRLRDIVESGSTSSRRTLMAMNVPPKRNINDESPFKVKRGVKTFDFSKESNLLVTGGLDRIVRIWNPYVPGWPTGLLRGHSSPINFLCIGDENTRIYSVSTDCTVMVWDVDEHTCLINVISKASQIRGEIGACYFSSHLRSLYIATESLATLQLQENSIHHGVSPVSHNEPVTCCQYNHSTQQVISCCKGSIIKTWDLLTGKLISEVTAAHGSSPITCSAMDKSGTRLVTAGKDGSLKQWDCTSDMVSHIKSMTELGSAGSRCEWSDLSYAEMNNIWYVITVGCDRRISVFLDQEVEMMAEDQFPQYSLINNMFPFIGQRKENEEGKYCIASIPPNFVATSIYNGEIILWNLATGEIISRLTASEREESENETDDLVINKISFILSRNEKIYETAILVASGPQGQITFWNISEGGSVFARFPGSLYRSVVNDMAISEDGSLLCSADGMNHVYIWEISQYALHKPEMEPPTLLHCWRAHQREITRVVLMSKHMLLITSSLDCSVKLWSLHGEHIGTFGQTKPWHIDRLPSWKEHHGDTSLNVQDQSLLPESGANPRLTYEMSLRNQNTPLEMAGNSTPVEDKDIEEELKGRNGFNSKSSLLEHRAYGEAAAMEVLNELRVHRASKLFHLPV
uniref:Uncharacterized protein n=1 Tax=Leptobrachium leishanense TaxID=445787 RepID=A0A8C5P9P0_9ANUR